MNKGNMLLLFQEGQFTTAKFQYPQTRNMADYGGQLYTFIVPIDVKLVVGDICAVYGVDGEIKLVKCASVDELPDVEYKGKITYQWIVQKIDIEAFNKRNEERKAFSQLIDRVERVRQREELIRDAAKNLPVDGESRALFEQFAGSYGMNLSVLEHVAANEDGQVSDWRSEQMKAQGLVTWAAWSALSKTEKDAWKMRYRSAHPIEA